MIFILEDNGERMTAFSNALGDVPFHGERTVPEACKWLSAHYAAVSLYSLDNDLSTPEQAEDAGEGWQLCEWLLANAAQAPVICHSTNAQAAIRMEEMCRKAGWPFRRVAPFNGSEWIARSWIEAVRELTCA